MNTPAGTSAISENTTLRAPLGRTIALAVGMCVAVATASIAYANLRARFEAHLADDHVHLNSGYHLAHGQPVGNFDFTQSLERITVKLDALEKKQSVMVCKRQGAEMVCNTKESP